LLDQVVVERLRNVGGDALVRRMLRLFLVTSDEAVTRIQGALSTGALHVVQAAAHHLFASAAQLRLGAIADMSEQLEQAARSGDVQAAQTVADQLTPLIREAGSSLRTLLAQLPQAPRVAVVDDSEDIRVLLRIALEPHFDITDYSDASSALLGIRRFKPDLMIIDISLPDMTGIDLLQLLRTDPNLQRIPAVALTALSHAALDYKGEGFEMMIRKPVVETDDLVRSLNQLLKSPEQ
jgi:two-component system, cell cycle response regulator DivK